MGFDSFSSFIVTAMRVIGSTVFGPHSAVLVGGEGQVGALTEDDVDEPGERVEDAAAYGGFGLVFRPRPPEQVDGEELGAEAMALRLAGQMTPIAWRDLRLNRKFPAPKPGTVALVGYGGGFLSFDDTAAKESLATLYVPYAHDASGVPQKAHAIVVDPDEGLTVVHADGAALSLTEEAAILKSPDGTAFVEVRDGKIVLNAPQVVCRGGLLIGDESFSPASPVAIIGAGGPTASLLVSSSA